MFSASSSIAEEIVAYGAIAPQQLRGLQLPPAITAPDQVEERSDGLIGEQWPPHAWYPEPPSRGLPLEYWLRRLHQPLTAEQYDELWRVMVNDFHDPQRGDDQSSRSRPST